MTATLELGGDEFCQINGVLNKYNEWYCSLTFFSYVIGPV